MRLKQVACLVDVMVSNAGVLHIMAYSNLQNADPSCLHAIAHVIACVLHQGCVQLLLY